MQTTRSTKGAKKSDPTRSKTDEDKRVGKNGHKVKKCKKSGHTLSPKYSNSSFPEVLGGGGRLGSRSKNMKSKSIFLKIVEHFCQRINIIYCILLQFNGRMKLLLGLAPGLIFNAYRNSITFAKVIIRDLIIGISIIFSLVFFIFSILDTIQYYSIQFKTEFLFHFSMN